MDTSQIYIIDCIAGAIATGLFFLDLFKMFC